MSYSLLSIIIPVYDAEDFIIDTINSILNQTYKNFELIIINDGSTDNSKDIIQSYNDDRIIYKENDTNHGIVYSRNRGLMLAKGNFIGMVDADDIVYPEKFEKQITFLEKNSDFGMIGSWVRFIDEKNKRLPGSWKLNAPAEMIPSIMLFKNYFLQSAILYKKECIRNYTFTKSFDILEDYLLWYQILKQYKAWNLPEYLIDYRIHNRGVTKKHVDEKTEKEKRFFRIQFKDLNIEVTNNELDLHLIIRNGKVIDNVKTLNAIKQWLKKIEIHNRKAKIYDNKLLSYVLVNRWAKACSNLELTKLKNLFYCIFSKMTYKYIIGVLTGKSNF